MTTETALVWNLGFNSKTSAAAATSRLKILEDLITDHSPSIIALQEVPANARLSFAGYTHLSGPGRLHTAVHTNVWSAHDRNEHLTRAVGFRLRYVRTAAEVYLWNVHFDPPLNGLSPASCSARIRTRFVPKWRKRLSGRAELIVGDFNVGPDDEAVTSKAGFWANRSLDYAAHHYKKTGDAFFNPSWSILSQQDSPCGTYYKSQDDDGAGPWLVVDQVLMSPSLARPATKHVTLITSVRGVDLFRSGGHKVPNEDVGSDHLPILTTFAM